MNTVDGVKNRKEIGTLGDQLEALALKALNIENRVDEVYDMIRPSIMVDAVSDIICSEAPLKVKGLERRLMELEETLNRINEKGEAVCAMLKEKLGTMTIE